MFLVKILCAEQENLLQPTGLTSLQGSLFSQYSLLSLNVSILQFLVTWHSVSVPYVLTWKHSESYQPPLNHLFVNPQWKGSWKRKENISHRCFKISQLCHPHLEAGENLSEKSVPENKIKVCSLSSKLIYSNRKFGRENSKILFTDGRASLSMALVTLQVEPTYLLLFWGL